jgi:hypothetical protein
MKTADNNGMQDWVADYKGEEENGRQTTTALGKRLISPPGRELEI